MSSAVGAASPAGRLAADGGGAISRNLLFQNRQWESVPFSVITSYSIHYTKLYDETSVSWKEPEGAEPVKLKHLRDHAHSRAISGRVSISPSLGRYNATRRAALV